LQFFDAALAQAMLAGLSELGSGRFDHAWQMTLAWAFEGADTFATYPGARKW
jgi:hypothetical protein